MSSKLLTSVGLLLMLLVPYLALFVLLHDFVIHYEGLLKMHDRSLENMYFLGCAQTGENPHNCRIKARGQMHAHST